MLLSTVSLTSAIFLPAIKSGITTLDLSFPRVTSVITTSSLSLSLYDTFVAASEMPVLSRLIDSG